MTDAHCHTRGKGSRHFICDPSDCVCADGDVRFYGLHPWNFTAPNAAPPLPGDIEALEAKLLADPRTGVGEIGLDRLKTRDITHAMRSAFSMQLDLAARLHRPVVVHGAKCWGETVAECRKRAGAIPSFLFHGFSRSWGLLNEIESIGGFISAGPAVLNLHAENYRKALASVPEKMLLAETDATEENSGAVPSVEEIAAELAKIRKTPLEELAAALESNAGRFAASLL